MGIFSGRNTIDIDRDMQKLDNDIRDLKKAIHNLLNEFHEQVDELEILKRLLKYSSGTTGISVLPYQPQSITIKDTRIELRHVEAQDAIKYVTLKKEKAKC